MTDVQTKEITIAGKQYRVPVRYAIGHSLTAGEASALNQTFHENIRNNLSKKEGLTQEQVDEYAGEYQFGVSNRVDPVEREAFSIALEAVKAKLRKDGKKLADYETEQLNEMAEKVVEANPQITALAQKRVEEQRAAAAEIVV